MALNSKNKSTYGKNLRRSAGKMASKIAFTAMPNLSQTVVSSKQAFTDIKQFALKGRSQLRVQNKYNKRTLLRPVSEIIQNAKDDLKSGKFYNEERLAEAQSSSMSDFLGTMSEDSDYEQESSDNSMAPFNRFIASTSANSMSSARAISDAQLKSAEYLGELSMSQHNQTLVMTRQQHLEQMNRFDNLEQIGMSLAEFNTKTMSEHIKATHQFYNDILNETRELRKSVDQMAKNINSRYGSGSKKKIAHDAIGNVFGGGSFNLSGYFDEVKRNIGNQIPFSMDMIKGIFNDFKASPISGLMSLAGSFMSPNGLKKSAGKIDKATQGLFSQYLGLMDQWKHGEKLSNNSFIATLQQLAGEFGAVDLNAKVKPDLSSYKNEAITLELEQKKAKAITEVIPSYLSQILKHVSRGKTEMFYNYDTGKFEDMKASRTKMDNDFNKSIKYTSDTTTQFFDMHADKLKFPSKEHEEAFKEDTETFLIYMYTNPPRKASDISSGAFYNDMLNKGMSFRLGEFSLKMLKARWMAATPAKRQEMMSEMMGNVSLVKDIANRRDIDLQSSGKSVLYNDLSKLNKNKKSLTINEDYQKQLLSQTAVSGDLDDYDIAAYNDRKRRDLNIYEDSSLLKDIASGKVKDIKSKFAGSSGSFFGKIKEGFKSVTDEIESKITTLTDVVASKTENILDGELGDFDLEPVSFAESSASPVKQKAVKVAKQVTGKNNKSKIRRRRKRSNIPSPIVTTNTTAQTISSSMIDYRPYFETLDSHLRNIAGLLSQDKAIHVSTDANGSMTGMMSGGSDTIKDIYGTGKETAGKMFKSLKNTFSNASSSIKSFTSSVSDKAPGLKDKAKNIITESKEKANEVVSDLKDKVPGLKDKAKNIITESKEKAKDIISGAQDKANNIINNVKQSGVKGTVGKFASKAKDTGLDILAKIASGISNAGGNISAYFKSDSFKELLGGMKSKIATGASIVKGFAGTLFEKIKSGGGALLKKGKGMAIGGAISSMLGLGPIPGAIIGTLFSKDKKKKATSEDDKQLNEMEKQDKTDGGFLDKFKAKKKKSVLLGAGISTMLGLGPMPGALLTMIFNKKFVKKKGADDKEDQKQAKEISEGVENAEKQSKGIGKGKKLKNLTIGAAASTLLGLGPMPGVIAASIWNKHKDKSAKKKAKEENKQAEGTANAMEEATKPKKKGGILSKIKNFFGKGKNLAIGATASTLLGLGPFPGLIVASMYNKKKYNKKNNKEEQNQTEQTAEAMTNGETRDKKGSFIATAGAKIKGAKDALKAKLFKDKEEKKKNKKYIEHAKQAREADAKGNTEKLDRLENTLFNKAKAEGDIESISKTQGMIADSSNNTGGGILKADPENPKKEGLLSKLGGMIGGLFSGGGGLGGILGTILTVAAPFLIGKLGKGVLDFIKNKLGFGGLGTENEQGDANFANWTDKIGGGFTALKTLATGKAISKLGLNQLAPGMGGAAMGAQASFEAAQYYNKQSEAYADRGADTLAEEEKGTAVKHTVKGINFAIKFKNAVVAFFKNEKVVKFFTKLKLNKLIEPAKTFFMKNSDNIISKVIKGAGKSLGKLTTKLGSIASVVGAWLPIVTAVAAFISGYNNAPRDRGISEVTPGFWKARLANAIAYAIDDLLCGIPDMIGLRDWFADMLTKLFMTKDEEASMEKSQRLQLDEYQQFLKDNDLNGEAFTQDMYNKMKHKSIWGHVKSAFGSDDLEKYKKGGKKNAELKEKYGGYVVNQNTINIDNSENANVVMGDSSGSGGRGLSLANKPTSEIIKTARDRLSKNIYGGNSAKITSDDLNTYIENEDKISNTNSKNNTNSKSKKKGFLSNLGSTISSAVKSGWSWLKSKFTGSGGRGDSTTNNNYTYYSQKDPKWANQTFGKYNGKRDTVKDGGCGPTVAAMALENLTGKQVSPSTMADLALKAGYKYDNGGTDPSFFNAAGNLYGVNFKQTSGFNNSTIESLKAGVPVPLLGKNGPYGPGSHYLLATGIDNSGNVSILDPQNKSNNKKHNVKSLINTTNSSMVTESSIVKTARGKTKNNKYVKYLRNFVFGRGSSFCQPVKKGTVQGTGYDDSVGHKGVDIHGERGTPIYAVADGTIYYSEYGHTVNTASHETPYSVKLQLKTPITVNGNTFYYVYYTHLQDNLKYNVKSSDKSKPTVKKGDLIGYMGTANNAVHLHISVMGSNGYEGGHKNTMDAFGWKYNQNLSSVGNENNSPTTENVSNGDNTENGNNGDNDGSTVVQSILNSVIKFNENSAYNSIKSMSLLKTIGNNDGSNDGNNDGSSDGSNSKPISTGGSSNKAKIWNYLKSKGLSNASIAGVMGNLYAESAFSPSNLQNTYEDTLGMSDESYTKKVDNGSYNNFVNDQAGYGLAQWTYHTLKQGLLNKANKKGTSISDLDTQLEYLFDEIERVGYNKNHTDVKTASNWWLHEYERPGDQSAKVENLRAGYAQDVFDEFNGSGGRGNNASILPYKVKNTIASMRPSIPDRMIYGRGGEISTDGPITISRSALTNKKNIALNKSLLESSRELIDKSNKIVSSNENSNKLDNKDDLMLTALQNIVSLLTDIRSSNKTISEKNFSPVIGVNSGSGGGYVPNSQKSVLIDNIIAGI